MSTFRIGDEHFLLDEQPFRILSGALHYFRVHPDHWADRIDKARLMGLNTIETYVAWNAHEPRRGEWDATGANDLGRFLDLVAEAGLYAIVRPGPYICAEWHNGGLPVWLTSLPGVGLRRSEPQYLAAVTEYLERVSEIVGPRQIDRGGPVILVQIENEYGAYGSDKAYLQHLVRVTRESGIRVPLTTIDQPTDQMLADGSLPGLHLTGSFGSRANERLATLRAHQGTGPLMCAEFWDGWFDWWGAKHHTTSVADSAAELDALLASGASVNLYMFHGGTNFGLTNGANDRGRYLPITTSYDYDAPLDESGHPTAKYQAYRDVIARYAPVAAEPLPPAAPTAPRFEVQLEARGDWTRGPATVTGQDAPPTFEQLGHLGAVIRYDVALPGCSGDAARPASAVFEIDEVRDRAWLEVDGRPVGALSRTLGENALLLPPGRSLSVLVEEQGRVNYDTRLGEHKGLIGAPRLGGVALLGWSATPIDLAAAAHAVAVSRAPDTDSTHGSNDGAPVALVGRFDLGEPVDLHLDTSTFGKGFAFVNGELLGRYWRNGPQQTLYVPAPLLQTGSNTIVVLELERVTRAEARFVAHPRLGPLEE